MATQLVSVLPQYTLTNGNDLSAGIFIPMVGGPLFPACFPDPCIITDDEGCILQVDGYYHLYSTQFYERGVPFVRLPYVRTRDFVTFENLAVMDNIVYPTKDMLPWESVPSYCSRPKNFWAPEVKFNPHTRLYNFYLTVQFNSDTHSGVHGIIVGTSNSPAEPPQRWKMLCNRDSIHCIDPQIFIHPVTKRWYLMWGSGHAPICMQALSDDGLCMVGEYRTLLTPHPERPFQKLLEAPTLTLFEGWWELAVSGDSAKDNYAVIVYRKKANKSRTNFWGPYDDEPFQIVLAGRGNGDWMNPGHHYRMLDTRGAEFWLVPAMNKFMMPLGDGYPPRFIHCMEVLRDRKGWPYFPYGVVDGGFSKGPALPAIPAIP